MTDELGPVEHTERGFEIINFQDYCQMWCSLQQSNLAIYEQPGSSAVWLGDNDKRMELDVSQVTALVAHLRAWLDTGSFVLKDAESSGQ